jgi:hypothetical protein
MLTTVNPVIDLNLEHKGLNFEAPPEFNYRKYAAVSYSNSTASFTINPPSTTTFTSKMFYLGCKVTVKITATNSNPANDLLTDNSFAFRQDALNKIIQTCNVSFGSTSVACTSYRFSGPFSHYMTQKQQFPGDLTMLDNTQNYNDSVGWINNPLSGYNNGIRQDGNLPRGCYPCTITNGPTSATIVADLYSTLFCPPLTNSNDNEQLGFTNLNQITVTINWLSDLTRIFSLNLDALPATVTAGSVNMSVILDQPTMYMQFSTAPRNYVPRPIAYNSPQIMNYQTFKTGQLDAGASDSITSNNIQLLCVPEYIMIFVKDSDGNDTYSTTDTYCNISSIVITLDNRSGLCSPMSEFDFFQVSKENGLCNSFTEFHGRTVVSGADKGLCGSVVLLRVGKDLVIDSHVGERRQMNLQVVVNYRNVNTTQPIKLPTLNINTITPQTLTLYPDGHGLLELGYSSFGGNYIPFTEVSSLEGGAFKDVMRNAIKYIKPIHDFIKEHKLISKGTEALSKMGIPYVSPTSAAVSKVAEKLGYGEMGGMPSGGMRSGGKKMSAKELRARIGQL